MRLSDKRDGNMRRPVLLALAVLLTGAAAEGGRFERTQESMLDATARVAEEGGQTLETAVILSEWKTARELFSRLPEAEQASVFSEIVRDLRASCGGGEDGKVSTVYVVDVFELAKCPGRLTAGEVQALGELLAGTREQAGFDAQLSAKLADANGAFGDGSDEKRSRTYNLLSAAKLEVRAYEYLPPLELARKAKNVEAVRVHLARMSEQASKSRNPDEILKAMALSIWLLENTRPTAEETAATFDAVTGFLLMLPEDSGDEWLKKFFAANPDTAVRYVLEAGRQTAAKVRVATGETPRYLWLQSGLAESVVAAGKPRTPEITRALTAIALGWLHAAKNFVAPPTPRRPVSSRQKKLLFPAEQIARYAPGDGWLALLPSDTATQLLVARGEIDVRTGNLDRVKDSVPLLARATPEAAAELAATCLRSWSTVLGTSVRGSEYLDASGVAVTEKAQAANLALLFDTLAAFRTSLAGPLDPNAVAAAFAACHGPRDIYRREDMRRLLDTVAGAKSDLAAALVQRTAAQLRRMWQDFAPAPEEDLHQATVEMFAAVRDGYEALDDILARALAEDEGNWGLWAVMGSARLAAADFYLNQLGQIEPADAGGQSVLLRFRQTRDAALVALGKATRQYRAAVATMDRSDYSTRVYAYRFQAIMMLSEIALAVLPPGTRDRELDALRADLLAIDGDRAGVHVAAFGQWVDAAESKVPAADKFAYVDAAFRVLGAEHMPERLEGLLTSWEDVLSEIELQARLDGSGKVGTSTDFGVFLVLRHTSTLGNSQNGFRPYVSDGQLVDLFRRNIERALGPHFYLKGIKLHAADVQPYHYGREGWQETPLAYLQLQVKDVSVDQLPPLQLDLYYGPRTRNRKLEEETRGVILPVRSEVVQIDPRHQERRPCTGIVLTQIFDDRAHARGRILLDIRATGRGMLPELDELLDLGGDRPIPGFHLLRTIERGTEVRELDSSKPPLAVVCERSWVIELALDDRRRAEARKFHFPKARPGVEQVCKRYEDATLVDCEPVLALAWIPWDVARLAAYLAGGALFIAVLWWGVYGMRRRAARREPAAAYAVPQAPDPFAVATLLRRIGEDAAVRLSEPECEALAADLRKIEEDYFARDVSAASAPDLPRIARRWVDAANRCSSS